MKGLSLKIMLVWLEFGDAYINDTEPSVICLRNKQR